MSKTVKLNKGFIPTTKSKAGTLIAYFRKDASAKTRLEVYKEAQPTFYENLKRL